MSSSNHLTVANPHRKIFALTWPVLLANLSTPLLGLVDTALLGHFNQASALAAAAIGASIYSYVFWGFGFLRQGATGLTAQALGQNNHQAQQLLLIQVLIMGFSAGLLLLAASTILIPISLELMQIKGQLNFLAGDYLQIRFLAAPFMLASFGLLGWLIGRQQTRAVMVVMVSANLLNIILDVWFIHVQNLGSQGAAIASSISEVFAFLLALGFATRQGFSCWSKNIWQQNWKPLLEQNHYLFQRSLLLLFCFSLFTAQGASFGTEVVAANSILFQLLLFCAYFLDAYAHTIETLAGEAQGKQARHELLGWIKNTAIWNFSTALLLLLLLVIFRQAISQGFSSNPQINSLVEQYIPWLFSLPLVAACCYFLDGVFIGITKAKEMRNSMLISFFVFLFCWSFFSGNNHGLWFAMLMLHIARSLSMGLYFFRWLE